MTEIDRCRPFIVVLVGSRWGWVPDDYKVPDPNLDRYTWLKTLEKGYSITALEVKYGFLNNPQQPVHAFAYIRDPTFLKDVPNDQRDTFEVCNPT
jgi:hypothetical protein